MIGHFNFIIVIIIIWIYYINLRYPDYPIVEYEDLKHKYKTGDLILFKALDNYNSIFIMSFYCHIGIIYIDPDDPEQIPYIFEAFAPDRMPFCPNENKNGIIIAPLESRLKTYRGYTLYKELITTEALDKDIILGFKEFIDYAHKNMSYNISVFNNGFNKFLLNEEFNHRTNCGELTYLSLIKLGLLPMNHIEINKFHPLVWLSNLTELPNSRGYYAEPIYVLSNYFRPLK